MNTPYAYEVTTTYLVRAGSVAHNNAVITETGIRG